MTRLHTPAQTYTPRPQIGSLLLFVYLSPEIHCSYIQVAYNWIVRLVTLNSVRTLRQDPFTQFTFVRPDV